MFHTSRADHLLRLFTLSLYVCLITTPLATSASAQEMGKLTGDMDVLQIKQQGQGISPLSSPSEDPPVGYEFGELPPNAINAMIEAIQTRSTGILDGGTYFVVGHYEAAGNWGVGHLAAAMGSTPTDWETSVWFITQSENTTRVALQGTPLFKELMVDIPLPFKTQIETGNNEVKAQAVVFLFPWDKSQQWRYTYGWHGAANLTLDFAPVNVTPANMWVLASASGTVTLVCSDGYQAAIDLSTSSGVMDYRHIDYNSFISQNVKDKAVSQGKRLALLYDGKQGEGYYNTSQNYPWPSCVQGSSPSCTYIKFNTFCGAGTGSHVHWTLPTKPLTVDGWQVDNNGLWTKSGSPNKPLYSLFDSTNSSFVTISGNAEIFEGTLSYMDGIAKTVITQADGSYIITVPAGWTGTITPSHACYTFSPANRTYNTINANQTSQNYTTVLNPACKEVEATIGNVPKGSYMMASGQSTSQSYNGTNGGPVVIQSTDGSNVIASLLQFRRPGTSGEWTDMTQVMGLTDTQISDSYVFPRYDSTDPKRYNSIQIANFDSISTNVTITIGGVLRGTYPLTAGSSQNVTYSNLASGPVVVKSDNTADIVASLYELKRTTDTGLYTGQTQMMGLPETQLSDTYIIPRYNYTLQDLLPYIVFANAGNAPTTVIVTIGGVIQGTHDLNVGESMVQSYSGVNGGPVVIQSDDDTNIIASLLQFRRPGTSGEWTGMTQVMGLTNTQISDSYVFPRYDSTDPKKYNSIQIANFDSISTNVTITIGGVLRGTYPLTAGSSQNVTYSNLASGPIVVKSDNAADIVASLYELKRTTDTGLYTGQTQMMGLPEIQLSDTYVIPRYNYTLQDLLPYLIFSVP